MYEDRVASAVATLVIQNKQILLGRRTENHQFIGWQCPGGYLQKGESIEQAAHRICLQKAGLTISSLRAGPYTNNIFSETKSHTTTLYVIAENFEIENKKNYENCIYQWRWFAIHQLPEALYLPLRQLVSQYDLAML